MSSVIPTGIEDITPEWLTAALGGEHQVDTFEVEPVGLGVGIMSILFRLTIDYAGVPGPTSLIVKMAPPYPAVREVARGYGFYEREVRIYTELGDSVGFRPAVCHHGAHDPETDDFVLILEDLGACRTPDQLDGCAPDDARVIVTELARHHANWWESPRLGQLSYIQSPADPPWPQFHESSTSQQWPLLLERFGEHVPARIRGLGDRWSQIGPAILEDAPNHPTTLGHGDVRLDNVFFRDDGGDPVTVVDWQISSRTAGAFDLAYFTSQSLTIENRRALEDELCRSYHDMLRSGGVEYDYDEFWTDYRRSVLFCLAYPMGAGALELVNDRAWALATAMLERSVAAIEDLDADELAPD